MAARLSCLPPPALPLAPTTSHICMYSVIHPVSQPASQSTSELATQFAMADVPANVAAGDRVRWGDEEAARAAVAAGNPAPQAPPPLRRAVSSGSLSIRSVRSRQGGDPSAMLPIQYRTV